MKTFKDVSSYIKGFPKDIQVSLRELQKTITLVAPKAEEAISYGMPGYKYLGKPLAYFAAFKEHIGFFPTPSGTKEFAKDIAKYKHSKGGVQFPLDAKIPLPLVKKMVRFRMKEIEKKSEK